MLLPSHPALRRLLLQQAASRASRLLRGFAGRGPRRLCLSLLASLLAMVWIGQTIATVLFREAADPTKLPDWIRLGMLGYLL